jgi:NitT/TauT family transport system substrate-binding protein
LKRIVVAIVAFALCGGTLRAEDVVRLGNLKFAHYGAVSYMKEIAPKYGLKIEERVFGKGLDIVPAIVAGDIDIAASALDAAIAGRAAGAPVFVVAGFAKGGIRIVRRADLPAIRRIGDLKGRKVGVARGGAQELALLAELRKAGLTWSDKDDKDVHLVYLAYADLNGALLGKQIDAMCQSEPQSAQAIAKGFGKEILKPYDTPMGEPIRALVMTEKMYSQKNLAERVLRCFVDATRTFLRDPALAEKYVRDDLFKGQLTHEEYVDALSNAAFTYDIDVKHVQITTDMMQQLGVGRMERPPLAASWVKLDLLERAKKSFGVR